jgi:hypothetical protein
MFVVVIFMLLKGDFDITPFGTTFMLLTMIVPLVGIVISVGYLSEVKLGPNLVV